MGSAPSTFVAVKTFAGLFCSSSAFGAAISIVYWFSSREYGGTLMLGLMAMALAFAAGYTWLAEKDAQIAGDDPDLQHKEAAGEDLGIVTKESAWPILLAFSILWFLVGLLWSDFMIVTGAIAILLIAWRLGAESARISFRRIPAGDGTDDIT